MLVLLSGALCFSWKYRAALDIPLSTVVSDTDLERCPCTSYCIICPPTVLSCYHLHHVLGVGVKKFNCLRREKIEMLSGNFL